MVLWRKCFIRFRFAAGLLNWIRKYVSKGRWINLLPVSWWLSYKRLVCWWHYSKKLPFPSFWRTSFWHIFSVLSSSELGRFIDHIFFKRVDLKKTEESRITRSLYHSHQFTRHEEFTIFLPRKSHPWIWTWK